MSITYCKYLNYLRIRLSFTKVILFFKTSGRPWLSQIEFEMSSILTLALSSLVHTDPLVLHSRTVWLGYLLAVLMKEAKTRLWQLLHIYQKQIRNIFFPEKKNTIPAMLNIRLYLPQHSYIGRFWAGASSVGDLPCLIVNPWCDLYLYFSSHRQSNIGRLVICSLASLVIIKSE
jgi:hypothetical protein